MIRVRINVRGIVQGVGFRPFIHRLVREYHFSGWVRNTSFGAELELEGEKNRLTQFAEAIKSVHPALAVVESVEVSELSGLNHYNGFKIAESKGSAVMQTLVSPDVAVCQDCLDEMRDPGDRRYGYP
ncbi:MAG TPA: carbamoyltransferase HypF, partial [Clostridiales bacterium]|nr:carbamoyltransferase HypF [Clostridiales bacterium]